ncbi:amidohydrolase family protein [Achromobacter mucicolens]|uniref:Amidohydrolase family protein n=1 Tax=Achromobacter mucicolens TaxID=1389922 RepID=A0ABD4YW43_9BURK|nr:amidohydrolase family protein [Achromobacter mucicolens]MDH1179692.1 amidohydrolase family protein [Achromobacter mucicolens]WGJ88891.1 amidohydrolase family protein [Achromobacter mucicolens]CAB3844046.1 2-pyrone-4,6-dicarbaxylate hydrolase [Achromobacter mucicolens]
MPSPLPGAAVDTHAHVFHQGLALADTRRHTPDYDATLAEYLDLLDAHGMRHGVLVQPSFLGTDNSHLVQALRAAPARLRGVAVVAQDIADTELQDLAGAGVVGIRLNLVGLDSPALQTPAWQSLLARVNALGWHVEIHLQAARLDGVMPALLAADCRIVVDHFGRPDPALGVSDPGFQYLLRQADSGRVWVKLAAPYRNWGAAACAASGRLATQQLLDAYTPERLMWGSDWPHTEHRHLASYAAATQWLDAWIDDPAQRRAVLADTPLQLFQFKGDAP